MSSTDPPAPPRRRLNASEDVERLGAAISAHLRAGDALCLSGPLGAGKSTLARGLIRARTGPDEDVPSPTFTLVQTYDTPGLAIAHFDLYRLKSPDEAFEIGLDEALEIGAVLIEWPERLTGHLPADRLDIELAFAEPGEAGGRTVAWAGRGAWAERARAIMDELGPGPDWI